MYKDLPYYTSKYVKKGSDGSRSDGKYGLLALTRPSFINKKGCDEKTMSDFG